MNLTASIYSIEELNNIKDYVSSVMIEHEFLSNPYHFKSSCIDLINESLKYNLVTILKVNRMVHPSDLDEIKKLLSEFISYNILFYVTDLGVAKILKDMNVINRVIYDPMTMICNSLDAKEYLDYGFNSVGLSLEIKIDDVKTISDKVANKIFYQVFGYHLMFHSKRSLVTLYGEKINKEINLSNMNLKEATRNDMYPIVQNEQGTLIYRSYLISLIKHIKELNIKYAYFEHFRIDNEVYLEIIKIYNDYIMNKETLINSIQKLEILNLNIKDGFTYQDSVYQKEEF